MSQVSAERGTRSVPRLELGERRGWEALRMAGVSLEGCGTRRMQAAAASGIGPAPAAETFAACSAPTPEPLPFAVWKLRPRKRLKEGKLQTS